MSSATFTAPHAPAAGGGLTIVWESQVGTVRTFEQLFDEWQKPIYTYLLRLVGNQWDAEDLTQETFLKAYRAFPRTGTVTIRAAWLYRIGTNTALDALRRRKLLAFLPWQDLEYELAEAGGQDPQALCETRELIRRALRRMPERYRAAFLLYRVEGCSQAEIARVLGLSYAGIRAYLHRATVSFLEHYTDLGGEVAQHDRHVCKKIREDNAS